MADFSLSFFSRFEEGYYLKIRQWRDRLLEPVSRWLTSHRVKPDYVSVASFLMVVGFVYFFLFNPAFSFVFLLGNLFLDILDGALARYQKSESIRGDLLDHALDYVSFVIIFLTFLAFQLVHFFWGAIFLVSYTAMIFFVVILRARNQDLFVVLRSKYLIYGLFFIWLLTGLNYFHPVVFFFSVYMVVMNVFLFHKLRCSFP